MKKIENAEMGLIHGGRFLNNHTLEEHLLCVGYGMLGALGGPWVCAGAMILCYLDH